MSYLISLLMLIIACVKHSDILMITSGLFAIAGSIDCFRGTVKIKIEK